MRSFAGHVRLGSSDGTVGDQFKINCAVMFLKSFLLPTRKSHPAWALLATLALAVGCAAPTDVKDDASSVGPAVRVEIAPDSMNIWRTGESAWLEATVYDSAGRIVRGLRFFWGVTNSGVVNLGARSNGDSRVLLTAQRFGATRVFVRATSSVVISGVRDTSLVTVSDAGTEVRRYAMRFENEFLDLDGDTVVVCGRGCAFPEGTDLKVAFNPTTGVHSVVVQNQAAGVEIAHIDGARFGDVTADDTQTASFTTSLVDVPFDRNRVILIRTDQDSVFKLGNPVEAELVVDGVTFETAQLN